MGSIGVEYFWFSSLFLIMCKVFFPSSKNSMESFIRSPASKLHPFIKIQLQRGVYFGYFLHRFRLSLLLLARSNNLPLLPYSYFRSLCLPLLPSQQHPAICICVMSFLFEKLFSYGKDIREASQHNYGKHLIYFNLYYQNFCSSQSTCYPLGQSQDGDSFPKIKTK